MKTGESQIYCECGNICFNLEDPSHNNLHCNNKHYRHHQQMQHKLGYKSINVTDLSSTFVVQPSSSIFHITCQHCKNIFFVRTYENYAELRVISSPNAHNTSVHSTQRKSGSKSLDDNDRYLLSINKDFSEKKTMQYIFPLELRKFCTVENRRYSADYIYENESDTADDLNDVFGAVFYPENQSLVGPYLSSPILNWNASNSYT